MRIEYRPYLTLLSQTFLAGAFIVTSYVGFWALSELTTYEVGRLSAAFHAGNTGGWIVANFANYPVHSTASLLFFVIVLAFVSLLAAVMSKQCLKLAGETLS